MAFVDETNLSQIETDLFAWVAELSELNLADIFWANSQYTPPTGLAYALVSKVGDEALAPTYQVEKLSGDETVFEKRTIGQRKRTYNLDFVSPDLLSLDAAHYAGLFASRTKLSRSIEIQSESDFALLGVSGPVNLDELDSQQNWIRTENLVLEISYTAVHREDLAILETVSLDSANIIIHE